MASRDVKLSKDPDFEKKLVDVVGLYLNPPERAVVFSFDEKTQCQALDRTQPSLPLKPSRAKTMTHDYKRNGTIDLFAALKKLSVDGGGNRVGRAAALIFERMRVHIQRDARGRVPETLRDDVHRSARAQQ